MERDFVFDPSLVLSLPLWKLDGAKIRSEDAYGHLCTAYGALWRPAGRWFDGINDYIGIPSSVIQLNFTSENFSIIARVYVNTFPGHVCIFNRGLWNTDGYKFLILSTGELRVETSQAAANQASESSAGVIATGRHCTIGMSRTGASVRLYKNGEDVTSTEGVHINPKTSGRTAAIGIASDLTSQPFNGGIREFLVFSKSLIAGDHMRFHQILKWGGDS